MWVHADTTIGALRLDDRGFVPWWQEEAPLLNVMAARLVDSVRHAGHADIVREWLDGSVGLADGSLPQHGRDSSYWERRHARLEEAARAADRRASGRTASPE